MAIGEMKTQVNENLCIGCGTCAAIAGKSFKMEGAKAKSINPAGDSKDVVKDAVESCPVQAIEITEE